MSTEGNGIICYNLESETSTSYTEKEGLKSNYIHSMKLDDWNRLWFTTNKGISYIDLKTRKVVSIGEYIGLNNLEYSYHIACKRKMVIWYLEQQMAPLSSPPSKKPIFNWNPS